MYHALGYSTIMYLQAMMTFEPVSTTSLIIRIHEFKTPTSVEFVLFKRD